jgi:cytochrome c oxidase cbb3-type subunit III
MNHHPFTTWLRILGDASRLRAAAATLIILAAGCNPPGKPDPANRPVMPDQILDFGPLFATNCAGCHGTKGELGPAPPLNDHLFVEIISEEELLRVIRDGRTGTPMPPFALKNGGSLTDAQLKVLAEGIKSHWKLQTPLETTPPAYALSKSQDVQSMPGSRERGAQVYERACAGCHGPNGAGGERNGSMGGAINVPAFLALISDQALRRIIITGRPDLGMPTSADQDGRPSDFQPLTSAEIDDLVALLADWRATRNVVRTGPTVIQP